jgi:hypothetical protein
MVAYSPTDDLHNVVNHERSQMSMLTKYFRMNIVDSFATSLLYREFPEYYQWDKANKEWLGRKQRTQIGRMVYAVPCRRRKILLVSASELCERSYFFR